MNTNKIRKKLVSVQTEMETGSLIDRIVITTQLHFGSALYDPWFDLGHALKVQMR